jgi:hypothetical protein
MAGQQKTAARWGLCLWGASILCLWFLGQGTLAPVAVADCPNEQYRTGASSTLPECRAYELLTPSDANGRLLEGISDFAYEKLRDLFPTELFSPERDSFLYLTYNSPLLAPEQPNGVFDLYETIRTPTGWATVRRLSPSGEQSVSPAVGGVSADHSYAFSHVSLQYGRTGGSLSDGHGVDYLGKPDGSFELSGVGRLGTEPLAQGRYITPGGGHVIFSTGAATDQSYWCFLAGPNCAVLRLEPKAPPTGTGAVYDRIVGGGTHVISLLPGDQTPDAGEQAFYRGVSADGTSVAFEIGGALYVRVDNGLQSERTEEVGSAALRFAGLSQEGRYLFYVTGDGSIHRVDTTTEADLEVNPGVEAEIVNVSADGSHVYFISEEEIGGSGEAGKPNLFDWSGGSTVYIATLAPSDLNRTSGSLEGLPALTNWTGWVANPPANGAEQGPGNDSSRTTPDGTTLVFESKAELTGYDNVNPSACPSWVSRGPDGLFGTPDDEVQNVEGRCTEVYRYDSGLKSLKCVSCGNSSQTPAGDAKLQNLSLAGPAMVIHNVTDDGRSVFFESPDPLLPKDVDGVNDIYEWSQEGLLPPVRSLISSGASKEYRPLNEGANGLPSPNVLLSITPSGHDVAFISQDGLVPAIGIGGIEAIYDARVGGGFPETQQSHVCGEEECRGPVGSHTFAPSAPRSEAIVGSGKVHHRNRHRGCRRVKAKKGKRRSHCARHSAGKSALARTSGAATKAPSAEASSVDNAASDDASEPSAEGPPVRSTSVIGSFDEFGIDSVTAEMSDNSAGAHPDLIVDFDLHHALREGLPYSDARTEGVTVVLPPGLLGNPNAVPRCDTGQFIAFANCDPNSQVGTAQVVVTNQNGEPREPIYNLTPPHPREEIARFGFFAIRYPVFIDIKVRTAGDYGVTATVHGAPGLAGLLASRTTLWGDPADESHDEQRLTAKEALSCVTACEAAGGKRASTISLADRKAFLTNPSICESMGIGLAVTSYQVPGRVFEKSAPLSPITACAGLPFAPTFSAEPTSHVPGAPTGLKTKLVLPQHLGEEERGTATMREARVTLPEGMQIAAGAANWIGTCSDEQVGFHKEVDTACPDNSKLGTATIISPAISTPIEGTIYQRSPQPGHQFGLWLTADALGLHIKLPGELEPDKTTGRLTAVFRDLPQVPVEEIDLDVWGGARAPLQNPDHCGTYTTDFSFTPHSEDPAANGQSQMQITEGCNQGFNPSLKAGVTDPVAGKFSPFVLDLTRPDGSQALRGFDLKLPDGELAKLKGVPLCADAAATAGNCPADSRIGSLRTTTGPGPDPLTLPEPGRPQPQIYLSGPYKGSPFSILSEVPAQAGPFDLGVLAVRSGLDVEPETGRALVKTDPLPQFFEGVGIAYRHLHAVVDRPDFNLNPTDCRAMAVTSDVTSTQGAVAHPSARFQVDGCKRLKFRPKLSLALKGGTKRANYPALTAVLKARRGDANIGFASVALPHSEFLAQEHIGTICTRVQFVADKCPKGSIYGKAKAITPLLDKPLSGPVYLRSSDHPLPDLVAKLGGELEIDLVGRIDSKNGGIRTTFESVPDAPISRFILQMKGGAKSLLTNSTDICRGSHKATVQMKAQNGRLAHLRPRLATSGCGKKKLGKHEKNH